MNFYELLILSAALSSDAFSVSVCKGLSMRKINIRHTLIISFSFGFFQALMPAAGWMIGTKFQPYIVKADHWIAFVLLSFIGFKMMFEAKNKQNEYISKKETMLNLNELITLSVATSIDAFAAGITLACFNINITLSVLLIGCITFMFCFLGVIIGNKAGANHKSKAEFAGGVILVAIGVKILIEHLTA